MNWDFIVVLCPLALPFCCKQTFSLCHLWLFETGQCENFCSEFDSIDTYEAVKQSEDQNNELKWADEQSLCRWERTDSFCTNGSSHVAKQVTGLIFWDVTSSRTRLIIVTWYLLTDLFWIWKHGHLFFGRFFPPQNCEKRLLALSCLSVRPSVRMDQLGPHFDDCD